MRGTQVKKLRKGAFPSLKGYAPFRVRRYLRNNFTGQIIDAGPHGMFRRLKKQYEDLRR